jgi:hypothetical protein
MYNYTVKRSSETIKPLWFRLSVPFGNDLKKVSLLRGKSKTIAVFSFLSTVRQLTKQRALPAADKNRGRYGTTNHSVLALIKRLEQIYKNVTCLRLYLDDLIRPAHLVYPLAEVQDRWSSTSMVTRYSYAL